MRWRALKAFAVLMGLAMVAACAETAPSRFYTLASIDGAGVQDAGADRAGQPARAKAARDLTVGLGPVVLPKYLDRSEIVRRTGTYEMALGDFDRWSEPLETMVPRVMAINLATALGTDRVLIFPQRRAPETDYHVEIEIFRFDAGSDGEVVLDAQWELYGVRTDRPLAVRRSTIRQAETGEGYAAVADAMSRALHGLSDDIATAIHKRDKTS